MGRPPSGRAELQSRPENPGLAGGLWDSAGRKRGRRRGKRWPGWEERRRESRASCGRSFAFPTRKRTGCISLASATKPCLATICRCRAISHAAFNYFSPCTNKNSYSRRKQPWICSQGGERHPGREGCPGSQHGEAGLVGHPALVVGTLQQTDVAPLAPHLRPAAGRDGE